MKTNLIALVLVFAIARLCGQGYFIVDFAGEGATIESIYVENLTQGTSLELEGTDVLHLLFDASNVINIEMGSRNLNIFPNPMEQTANIEFFNAKHGLVDIKLFSISGKQILNYSNVLSKGSHTFSLSGVAAGSYIINVKTETDYFTGKFVSLKQTGTSPVLNHKVGNKTNSITENAGSTEPTHRKKFDKRGINAIVEMNFSIGDELRFLGYAEGYESHIIFDSPTNDRTYNFVFTLFECGGLFTDKRDWNIYQTVPLGNQCWMRENLRTSTYTNGTPIPLVTANSAWSGQSSGAYTYFDNDPTTASTYGYMYNGHAVITGNLCPDGWHVPSIAEWQQLATYLSANDYHCGTNTSWIAKAMASNTGWSYAANGCAPGNNLATNNASGLTVMPAGFRNYADGLFYTQYQRAYIWTTDNVQGFPNSYYYIFLDYGDLGITTTYMSDIRAGHTVRCIKD